MSELFIEIGTEELPASVVVPAAQALAAGLARALGSIPHGEARIFGTPRRIAVAIADVAAMRPTVERIVTGPLVSQAYSGGEPGPAALAFARRYSVPVETLLHVDGPKGPVIGVLRIEGGESTADVIGRALEEVVLGIPFKRSMRWTSINVRFSRPIHRVCALFDGRVIESAVAGILTGGFSTGHWLWSPEPFQVESAEHWVDTLRERWVLADVTERRAAILTELDALALDLGADRTFDTSLVDEVVQLVEWPRALASRFADTLLELPPRLLVESMKKNQRYFPLTRGGALTSEFLLVTNNPAGDDELIAAGNARVLAARFHDARFFYAEDRKKPLALHGERLAGMMWIRGFGTMAERQAALADAAAGVARLIGADADAARAAGAVSKCDLTTQMVGEFPELQGHVGRLLAELEGYPAPVALAIEEHYLPRFAGDDTPATGPGRALALAERLTLLARAFAGGHAPKGGADPLGLRRTANGILAIVLAADWRGSLSDLFAAAGASGGDDLFEFVLARLRATLGESAPPDVVDAVLAAPPRAVSGPGGVDPSWASARVLAFAARVESGELGPIRTTFRRAAGLVKDHGSTGFDLALLGGEAGSELAAALDRVPFSACGPFPAGVAGALDALAALRPFVDRYFDAVLVMCDEPAARSSRLGLLRAIVERFSGLADFTRFSGD